MDEISAAEWAKLLGLVREINDGFPEGVVFIGGVAVHAWAAESSLAQPFAIGSHDADFMISVVDFMDLRDIEAVVANRRLNKQQFIKEAFEFDVYVEGQHNLAIPVPEIIQASFVKNGIRVASIGHLLALKLDAFCNRRGTPKGDKDRKDLACIVLCVASHLHRNTLDMGYIDDRRRTLLADALSGDTFLQLCRGNAHLARQMKQHADEALKYIDSARQNFSPTDPEGAVPNGGYRAPEPS